MTAGDDNEPAYVLHSRPYRETSLLVDVFTLNQGRLGLIAKGVSRPRNPWKAQLQPFRPLLIGWRGRGELKTLTDVESRPHTPFQGQQRLFCGFYLNELLQRLLPRHEPAPELFAAYIAALESLRQDEDLEWGLRRFELQLVSALGYGFRWDWVSDRDTAVEEGQYYAFDPEQGILLEPGPGTLMRDLPGRSLLALAAGPATAEPERRLAKQVMRRLIDHLLQGRPLHSRRLFN